MMAWVGTITVRFLVALAAFGRRSTEACRIAPAVMSSTLISPQYLTIWAMKRCGLPAPRYIAAAFGNVRTS
jgi:hypothetical protein